MNAAAAPATHAADHSHGLRSETRSVAPKQRHPACRQSTHIGSMALARGSSSSFTCASSTMLAKTRRSSALISPRGVIGQVDRSPLALLRRSPWRPLLPSRRKQPRRQKATNAAVARQLPVSSDDIQVCYLTFLTERDLLLASRAPLHRRSPPIDPARQRDGSHPEQRGRPGDRARDAKRDHRIATFRCRATRSKVRASMVCVPAPLETPGASKDRLRRSGRHERHP